MSKRVLTEKQKLFLEFLFDEDCNGDFVRAKEKAGYSMNYSTTDLVDSLREEILEASKDHLLRTGPKAVVALERLLDKPTKLGGATQLKAIGSILDRIGVVKTEVIKVEGDNIFILPEKDEK